MPVDDSVIEKNLIVLDSKISKLTLELDPLQELRNNFKKIQKITNRIQDDKGLTQEIEITPNRNNLSDADNTKVRQICYDSCVTKFKELNLN